MNIEWIYAIWGGVLIGLSVSLMLFLTGRVTGISGILYGLLNSQKEDFSWRASLLLGLVSGGLVLNLVKPEVFQSTLPISDWTVGIAGILVGFGTVLGSGCTSGHGVCGISRLSPRSILATLLFVSSGIVSVVVFRKFGILP